MSSGAFVGCNCGVDVEQMVQRHDAVWLFDPIPPVCEMLVDRYSSENYRHKSIKIVQAACFSDECVRKFNVYNTNGLSSSLGYITQDAVKQFPQYNLELQDTFSVQCVMLNKYIPIWLDELIIDAQGADLTILKTIEVWLANARIGKIQIECDGAGFQHYTGLPDNDEESLMQFMQPFPYDCSRLPDVHPSNPDFLFVRRK